MEKITSLKELKEIMTPLPRGGYLVDTSAGYIQFGAPPETLKDTILLPKSVPQIFILPYNHFYPAQGISMAEVEFPMYYNFFLKKRKIVVYCNPDHIENMKIVLNEAAFGPEEINLENEVEKIEGYHIPDLMSEMKFFRHGLKLSDMIDIRGIDPQGFQVEGVRIIPKEDHSFEVIDEGKPAVTIPAKLEFQIHYDLGTTLAEPFLPPEFGITCLGPSHGFDPEQNTSGFILWVNKVGIMVDPPVNSTSWLKDSNVNPKLIDAVILTHCHADHDSGTFQKILEETKITVYSTPTVMQSFIKKYSALTRIPAKTLMNMFEFYPVKMNAQYNIHGAIFNFYYSLHSIPTIGFHFTYRDKTFLYSSDHLNEPAITKQIMEQGHMAKERYEYLVNFPWNSFDIIYHEAGIPPLHTPVSYLNSLPKEIQKKITVYHIAEKDFPGETDLTMAKFGMGETVYPAIARHRFEEPYNILDVFSRIDIFKDLPFERIKDLLLIVKEESFEKGDYIIRKDTAGDKFYIIVSGNVSIGGIKDVEDKVYGTFEYFGEASLLMNSKRTADVIAATNVKAYSIEKNSFLRLIRDTQVEANIKHVAKIRDGVTWNVIKANEFFKKLSSSQVTQLESIFKPVKLKKNETIIGEKKKIRDIYILVSGKVEVSKDKKEIRILKQGDLIGEYQNIKEDIPSDKTYKALEDVQLFKIEGKDFIGFLTDNPGVLMDILFESKNSH